MQEYVEGFTALGVETVALLYDSPRDLKYFARKHGLDFSLVSDKGSAVIRELGLLNTKMDPRTRYYGVPLPGIFLLDPEGRIVAKFAEQNYRDRPAFADLTDAVSSLTQQEVTEQEPSQPDMYR